MTTISSNTEKNETDLFEKTSLFSFFDAYDTIRLEYEERSETLSQDQRRGVTGYGGSVDRGE